MERRRVPDSCNGAASLRDHCPETNISHVIETNSQIYHDKRRQTLNKDADAASGWKALLFDEQVRGVTMRKCLTRIFTASFTVSLGLKSGEQRFTGPHRRSTTQRTRSDHLMSQDRREITEGRYPKNKPTIRRQLRHRYMYIFNLTRERIYQ